MESLRTISKDPRIGAKAWEALPLEEKIPMLRSIAKVADYDAINGSLTVTLHNSEGSHQFPLRLTELKHVPYHRQQAEISKEPLIRQNLILAHQINQVTSERKCSLKEIAGWIGVSHTRVWHIANMLLISPEIQEEILLSTNKALFSIPEYKLREVSTEIDWNKQQEIWNTLLQSQQK